MTIFMQAACSNHKNTGNELPSKISVTIYIEKKAENIVNLVHLSSKGHQTEEAAIFPIDKTLIAGDKITVELYEDLEYSLQVSPTAYKTMDEFLKMKKGKETASEEKISKSQIKFMPSSTKNTLMIPAECSRTE